MKMLVEVSKTAPVCAVLALALIAQAQTNKPQPVATAHDIKSTVTHYPGGVKVREGEALYSEQRFECKPGAKLKITYKKSGRTDTITPEDNIFRVPNIPGQAPPDSTKPGGVAVVLPDSLVTMPGATAAGDPPFHLISPIETTISSDQPSFHWQRIPRAQSYRLDVKRDGLSAPGYPHGDIMETEFVPERPLIRGSTYTWVVAAYDPRGKLITVSDQGAVTVADIELADRCARAKEATNTSVEMKAHELVEMQLYRDAERILVHQLALTPDDRSAEQLLLEIRQARKRAADGKAGADKSKR